MPATRRPAPVVLLLLLVASCATPGRRGEDTVAIQIANQSRESVVVYIGQSGAPGALLGTVPTLDGRTFDVSVTALAGERFLYSAPATRDVTARAAYRDINPTSTEPRELRLTAPFSVQGARSLRWVIRDGERLSAVSLR